MNRYRFSFQALRGGHVLEAHGGGAAPLGRAAPPPRRRVSSGAPRTPRPAGSPSRHPWPAAAGSHGAFWFPVLKMQLFSHELSVFRGLKPLIVHIQLMCAPLLTPEKLSHSPSDSRFFSRRVLVKLFLVVCPTAPPTSRFL